MGNSSAIRAVADCYRNGFGVRKNTVEALKYYRKVDKDYTISSSSSESGASCSEVGSRDDSRADSRTGSRAGSRAGSRTSSMAGSEGGNELTSRRWNSNTSANKDRIIFEQFKKAAGMGDAKSTYNVGNCYEHGIGVEKDELEAFKYYQKAADLGHYNGAYNVGVFYENGIGVEKNELEAFKYYQKAADLGYSNGAYNVGVFYEKGIGIEKDECKTFVYFLKSADMGSADGAFNVGVCYRNGIGVKKDECKAFEYYLKAADMGHIKGIYNVGYLYHRGIGVEKNKNKAFIYYKKAADLNYKNGIHNVGYCYQHGIGVEKDERKAFEHYYKAADMDLVVGMSQVARCYRNRNGIGVERDLQTANYWYQRANNTMIENYEDVSEKFDIDDDLRKMLIENKYQLLLIPYAEFEDIKEIGKGGFSNVCRARWLDKSQDIDTLVALKIISTNNIKEFIEELKAYCEIGNVNLSFIKCYGISRNYNGKYIIVLEYAKKKSSRKNLHDVSQMNWEKKLKLLHIMICDHL